MIKLIVELLLLYFLYKLIVDFIIPVYRATGKVKEQMENLRRHSEKEAYHTNNTGAASVSKEKEKGDYIDFEEIK